MWADQSWIVRRSKLHNPLSIQRRQAGSRRAREWNCGRDGVMFGPYDSALRTATPKQDESWQRVPNRAHRVRRLGHERRTAMLAARREANAGPSFTSAYPPASPPWLQSGRRRRTRRCIVTPDSRSTRGTCRMAVRGITAVGKRLDESPYTAWLRDQRRTIRRAARYASWVSSTTAIAFFNPYTPQNRPGPRPGCRQSSGTMC